MKPFLLFVTKIHIISTSPTTKNMNMMMMILVVGHKGVVYLGLGTAGAVT